MQCVYCQDDDASESVVTVVATCSNHCDVYAHEACFCARRSTSSYRKKNYNRDNRECELCPHVGCVGRLSAVRVRSERPFSSSCALRVPGRRKGQQEGEARRTTTTDVEDACEFFARDGSRCTRRAVAHGACKLHMTQALHKAKMIADMYRQEVDEKETRKDTILTKDGGTQTTSSTTTKESGTQTTSSTTTKDGGTHTTTSGCRWFGTTKEHGSTQTSGGELRSLRHFMKECKDAKNLVAAKDAEIARLKERIADLESLHASHKTALVSHASEIADVVHMTRTDTVHRIIRLLSENVQNNTW